ncbi:MAG: DUF5911 domain-containing protein, partial [Anaerolineae bacterium]|nr:DUF5911 domain-containing protein [Anaerolineae bacterium]
MDLALVGNCNIAALIDRNSRIVWYCLPRLDGDPVFHQLLGAPQGRPTDGAFSIEMEGLQESEQSYIENTAIVRTVLKGNSGAVEIIDFAPRYESRGRAYRPKTLVRQIRPISGTPRLSISIRPSFEYGALEPAITYGSNHIRYVGPRFTLRLTTDAPIDYVLEGTTFNLHEP